MEKKKKNVAFYIIIFVLGIIGGIYISSVYVNKNSNDINDKNKSNSNNNEVVVNNENLEEKFKEKASVFSSINEYIKYLLSFTPSKFDDNGKLQSIDRNYLNDDPKNISYVILKYIRANIKNDQNEKIGTDGNYVVSYSVDKVNKILKEYFNIEDFNFVPLYIEDTGAYGLEKVNNEYVTKTAGTEFSFPTYNIVSIDYDDKLVKVSITYDYQDNPNADRVIQNGKLILKYNNGNFNFEKIEFEN